MKIDRWVEAGRAIIAVTGEIDLAIEDELVFALRDAADEARGGQVIVDLSHTRFLDASGIRALLTGYLAATAAGSTYQVTGAVGMVHRVLAVTRVLPLLTGEADASGTGEADASG